VPYSSKPFLTDRKRLPEILKNATLQTQTSIGMYCRELKNTLRAWLLNPYRTDRDYRYCPPRPGCRQ
jgi:hypothetical protein